MSYTEHYTGSISYSGYADYTYPASEHGGSGSVYYSGSVPVEINVEVDTRPFERSVDDTNVALSSVTAALSATELAQVEAIRESAAKIARAATKGFFGVLSSELSSRVSEFASTMRSSVGLLCQEAQAVDNVHHQMESDYHAIKSRYARIFSELDRELDRRIRELDLAAFRISTTSMRDVVETPYETNAGRVFSQTIDTHDYPLKLQCARTKERVSETLGTMGDLCDFIAEYSSSLSQVMDDTPGHGASFVPVVYTIQEDQGSAQRRIVVHASDGPDESRLRQSVTSFVASRPAASWTSLEPEHKSALDNEFMRLVDSYANTGSNATDQTERGRVCQTMLALYRQTNPQTTYATMAAHQ